MSRSIKIFNPDELKEVVRQEVSDLLKKMDSEKKQSQILLTRKEAAKELNISLVTLHDWVNKGFLPEPVKIGNRSYFNAESFRSFLSNLKNNSHGSAK